MNSKEIMKLLKSKNYIDAINLIASEVHEEPAQRLMTPASVFEALKLYRFARVESFFVIHLDGSHQIIKVERVSQGIAGKTIVHPREVFRSAILNNASAIIVAHNHPSGNLTPSAEDIDITKRLKEAGKLLGIELLDHVIFTRTAFMSFLETGVLPL